MRKSILSIVFVLLFTIGFIQPDSAHAVDTTPPVLKSLVFLNADNVQADEGLKVEMEIEDTSGVYASFTFEDSDGNEISFNKDDLYSGKTTFTFNLFSELPDDPNDPEGGSHKVYYVPNGALTLTRVYLEDGNNNSVYYDVASSDITLDDLGISREITISGSEYTGEEWGYTDPVDPDPADIPDPVIKSLVIRNAGAVDANGYMTIDIDVEKDKIDSFVLFFKNEDGTDSVGIGYNLENYPGSGWVEDVHDLGIKPFIGKKTIKIPALNRFHNGTYELYAIGIQGIREGTSSGTTGIRKLLLYDPEEECYFDDGGKADKIFPETWDDGPGAYSCYIDEYRNELEPVKWLTDSTITNQISVINSIKDETAPVINRAAIINNDIVLPSVLKMDMDVTEDGIGIQYMEIGLINEKGHTIHLSCEANPWVKTGTWTAKMPVNPFAGEGTYTLFSISVEDNSGNCSHYEGADLDAICADKTLTLRSPYEVAYEGVLGDTSGVMEAVANMNEGETAVLDAREAHIIPKALFESIAGQDKTIVAVTEDMEWIFNGKDISLSRCKDVDVYTEIWEENGSKWGFDNDKKILMLEFADNGVLPGKARIRINNEYISARFKMGQDHLMLTYVTAKTIDIEDANVPIEEDEAAVITIDHNSSFLLSRKDPSIRITFIKKGPYTYTGKAIKPGIKVKVGNRKPTYSKKYKNYVSVGTAKVTVRLKKSGKVNSKPYIIKPKKAVISKITAGKKKIKVRMKYKPSSLGATKYLIEYRVAGKGGWKKTTTSGKTKTIKKLKKGKRYQVKVYAYKGSYIGTYSKTKKSPRVK